MKHSFNIDDLNTKENLYLCSWNYGDTVEIHTRETLKKEHSDMFGTPAESYEAIHGSDVYDTLGELLDDMATGDHDDDLSYTSDNFTIKMIK
tara:strand:- start:3986 stop:4261 length:276 start_codon:yes stop_codon:yes gene_type:complete